MSAADSGRRCAVYARVSSLGQASIPDQTKWGRRLAQEQAWELAEVVTDEGIKGDTLERPGLTALKALFTRSQREGRPIGRLLVWATDRLSRADTLDVFALLADLRSHGLRWVHTPDRVLDLTNSLDRTLFSIEQDHKNNPFLKDHGRKALRGMSEVVQAGFWVGRVPLGYRLVKDAAKHGGKRRRSGKLEIDEEKAPLVRELFARYAAGESTVSLAGWLSSKASPPSAARWSAQTVRQLLMNSTYLGTQTFGRSARGKHVRLEAGQPVEREGGPKDNLAGALVRPGAVPALVEEDLFRRVQSRLASGRRRSHRKDSAPLPLSSLGACGHCKGPLHAVWVTVPGASPKKRTARLICANRHRYGVDSCPDGSTGCPHAPVLAKVLELLAKNILIDGATKRIAALAAQQAGEESARRADERDALRQQLGKLDAALGRAQDQLFTAPADLVEDYQAGARRARAQRDELRARLAALDAAPPPAREVDPERFRRFWSLCEAAVGGKVSAEGGALNEVLKELVERFTLHFKRDSRGRATLDRVEVELPLWLSELVSSVTPT